MWFVFGLFSFLALLEWLFFQRSKRWIHNKRHPGLLFLLCFLLLALCFFLIPRHEPSLSSQSMVFGIDSRMSHEAILQAKEIVKKAARKLSCPVGLIGESGQWISPLSEDRIFFLLKLEGVASEPSFSRETFPSRFRERTSDMSVILFTALPGAEKNSLSSMVCIPTGSMKQWNVLEKNFSSLVSNQGLVERIHEKEFAKRGEGSAWIKPYEKEQLGFFLLLAFFFLYRFRRVYPLIVLIQAMSGALWSELPEVYDENRLAASLVESGEMVQAKRYLRERYMTEAEEEKRSSFAYNLALLSARSQDFKEALFWYTKIDDRFLSNKEILLFGRDLFSSILLEGERSEKIRSELKNLLQKGKESDWSKAALLSSPDLVPLPLYGLSLLAQRATSPELFLIDEAWKNDLIALLHKEADTLFLSCESESRSFLRSHFERALSQKDIERLAILLELCYAPTTLDKMEKLIAFGIREGRLFSFFHVWSGEREKTAEWMVHLYLWLSERGRYDARLKTKEGSSLFLAAWDMGGSFQNRWQRLDYLEQVVRQDEESPFKQSLLFLSLLPNATERRMMLALLLDWLGYKSTEGSTPLSSFLDAWIALDPSSMVYTLYSPTLLHESTESLFQNGGEEILLVFFQKAIPFLLQCQEGQQSASLLIPPTCSLLEDIKQQLVRVRERDLFMREVFKLVKGVYARIEPSLITNQEKSIGAHLLSLLQEGLSVEKMTLKEASDLLDRLKEILALLGHVFGQKTEDFIPRSLQEEQKAPHPYGMEGIDEEKAVQIILELEREEQKTEKEVA